MMVKKSNDKTTANEPFTLGERLDLVLRLIQRSDSQRIAYSTRASVIIAGNALLIGSLFLIVNKGVSLHSPWSVFYAQFMVGIFFCSLFSLTTAIAAIVNIRSGTTRSGYKNENRLLLHPGDTLKRFPSPNKLSNDFSSFSREDFCVFALDYLWVALNCESKRYKYLRLSSISLICSIFLFYAILFLVVFGQDLFCLAGNNVL